MTYKPKELKELIEKKIFKDVLREGLPETKY